MDATLRILTDADVAARADMRALIAVIERALRAKAEGRLVAPPRHRVEFGERGGLVFTVGGVIGDGDLAGFRAYETFQGPDDNHTQLVAVWNNANAAFKGIVVGDLLGAVRTGAIGGAAIKAMARADARVLALIGSGFQARTQAWAAAAVRPIAEIRVYSRSDDNRRKFAADIGAQLGVKVIASDAAERAVAGADIVICATSSNTPVIDAAWLAPGAHVTTIGPKIKGRHELGLDVADRAGLIATDSPAQIAALDFFLDGTDHGTRMVDLADIVTGRHPGRTSDDMIMLFCSAGLAGTEVLVADALLGMS
jgi:ornithine cyclodeaminase/alanine dehydrogenase-like protein (mu-crystallin family)